MMPAEWIAYLNRLLMTAVINFSDFLTTESFMNLAIQTSVENKWLQADLTNRVETASSPLRVVPGHGRVRAIEIREMGR
jgi:hypothetical protein